MRYLSLAAVIKHFSLRTLTYQRAFVCVDYVYHYFSCKIKTKKKKKDLFLNDKLLPVNKNYIFIIESDCFPKHCFTFCKFP